MNTRFKRIASKAIPDSIYGVVRETIKGRRLAEVEERLRWTTALLSRHLYTEGVGGRAQSELTDFEFGIHSQNGEDGILLFLFSVVGTTDRRFVEFGIGDGRICNTANLSRNWGWSGLLMDADRRLVESARRTYERWLGAGPVRIRETLVTADNVNAVFREEGFEGSIDLLSIDIDGNDYWIWKALDVLLPRVVVIEYNASFGPERSVTIPYDPHFDRFRSDPSGIHHGASLAALTTLGNEKGYAFIGCDSRGVNAFFVRRELVTQPLRESTPSNGWRPIAERSDLTQDQQEALLRRSSAVEV